VPKILPLLGCFERSFESSSACLNPKLGVGHEQQMHNMDHMSNQLLTVFFPGLSQHFLAPRKLDKVWDEKHGFLPSLLIVTAMVQ